MTPVFGSGDEAGNIQTRSEKRKSPQSEKQILHRRLVCQLRGRHSVGRPHSRCASLRVRIEDKSQTHLKKQGQSKCSGVMMTLNGLSVGCTIRDGDNISSDPPPTRSSQRGKVVGSREWWLQVGLKSMGAVAIPLLRRHRRGPHASG